MPQFKTYTKIIVGDGSSTPEYIQGVTACLNTIEGTATGKKLLDKICQYAFTKTIVDTASGNSHSAANRPQGSPKLVAAIAANDSGSFTTELKAAFDKAKTRGITLEHFARQLSMGMTPVSYNAAATNVARPTTNAKFGQAKGSFDQGLQIAGTIQTLQDMMNGRITLDKIPADWRYHLPRLLRDHMTPGTGSDSTVNFNPTKTFNCPLDKAMHQRPPAVGLAHELIHSLHASQGLLMSLVRNPQGENLEELITTGLPPYHFEEISDNLLRTQWPQDMSIRTRY
jgi:hypothetical protein